MAVTRRRRFGRHVLSVAPALRQRRRFSLDEQLVVPGESEEQTADDQRLAVIEVQRGTLRLGFFGRQREIRPSPFGEWKLSWRKQQVVTHVGGTKRPLPVVNEVVQNSRTHASAAG